MKPKLPLLFGLCSVSQLTAAGVMTGLSADNAFRSNNSVRTVTSVDEVVRANNSNNADNARGVVFVFELPNLGSGQSFSAATLSFTLLENGPNSVLNSDTTSAFSGGNTPSANLDLYGLGARSTSTVVIGDGYFDSTPDPTDATLIGADFVTSSTSVGTVTFSGPSLVNYLNAEYDGGSGSGKFVFLRLNPDAAPGSAATTEERYRVSMADNTGTTAYSKITPQISYSVIPEPSAALLSGLGFLALMRRRR